MEWQQWCYADFTSWYFGNVPWLRFWFFPQLLKMFRENVLNMWWPDISENVPWVRLWNFTSWYLWQSTGTCSNITSWMIFWNLVSWNVWKISMKTFWTCDVLKDFEILRPDICDKIHGRMFKQYFRICFKKPVNNILKFCFPQCWNFPCKLFEHVTSWHLSRISMNKILNFLRPDMIFVKKSMGGFSKITSWHVWKRSRSILRSCFLIFLKDYLNMWYPGILADFSRVIFGNFDSWSSWTCSKKSGGNKWNLIHGKISKESGSTVSKY